MVIFFKIIIASRCSQIFDKVCPFTTPTYVRESGALRVEKLREIWLSPTSPLHQDSRGSNTVLRGQPSQGSQTSKPLGTGGPRCREEHR